MSRYAQDRNSSVVVASGSPTGFKVCATGGNTCLVNLAKNPWLCHKDWKGWKSGRDKKDLGEVVVIMIGVIMINGHQRILTNIIQYVNIVIFSNLAAFALKIIMNLKETNLEVAWTKYRVLNGRILVIAGMCPFHYVCVLKEINVEGKTTDTEKNK